MQSRVINVKKASVVIMSKSRLTNALPLQYFVRRQQSLKLYRQFLRHSRRLPDDMKYGVVEQVRNEFRRNQSIEDHAAIRMLIQEGNRELEKLKGLSASIQKE